MKREINMRQAPSKKSHPTNNPADMKEQGSIITDPNGSYTGIVTDGSIYDRPIQDADDL